MTQTEPSGYALAEFLLLLSLAAITYGLQTISEIMGQVLALPLYIAFAMFFWKRGPVLATAQAPLVSAVLGARAGKASAAAYSVAFRAIGMVALLLLPISLICYIAIRLA